MKRISFKLILLRLTAPLLSQQTAEPLLSNSLQSAIHRSRHASVRATNSDAERSYTNSSGSILFPVSPCPRVSASLILQHCAPAASASHSAAPLSCPPNVGELGPEALRPTFSDGLPFVATKGALRKPTSADLQPCK